jgi:predicted site-specific integrase-resolvase
MKRKSDSSQKNPTTPATGWMRREQAAAYCGISPRTLSEWQSRRLIPFAKVSHKVCLFRAADLDKALGKLVVAAVDG